MLSLAVAVAAGAALSGQVPREWRDYAGGPDSSRFVAATQITKANVSQLEVAWTYPAGQTDFNPLVVRGTVYGRGAATPSSRSTRRPASSSGSTRACRASTAAA